MKGSIRQRRTENDMTEEYVGENRPAWARPYVEEVLAKLMAEEYAGPEQVMRYHSGLGRSLTEVGDNLWDAIVRVGEDSSEAEKWQILESSVMKMRATRNFPHDRR